MYFSLFVLEIDELGEDITPTDIGRLPCGALEDPVLLVYLFIYDFNLK